MAAEQLVQTCLRLHGVRKAHKDAVDEVSLLTSQENSVTGAVAGLQFQECCKLSRRLEVAQECSTFFEETLPSNLVRRTLLLQLAKLMGHPNSGPKLPVTMRGQ